jgi:hypothetical protein
MATPPMSNDKTIMPDTVMSHVRGVEGRVAGIEREVSSLGQRFEAGFAGINTELKALGNRLAASPNYRVGEVLDVVTKGAALLGMAAASIIFISTSISSGPIATIQTELRQERERAARIERALERLTATHISGLAK